MSAARTPEQRLRRFGLRFCNNPSCAKEFLPNNELQCTCSPACGRVASGVKRNYNNQLQKCGVRERVQNVNRGLIEAAIRAWAIRKNVSISAKW